MNKFITDRDLIEAIDSIIWEAEKTLLIVSPYIRLDNYFKKLFERHLQNHHLHIVLVFGKNENEVSKSLSSDDFEYFKRFPNISIIYAANLHAKYYGNEKKGVITSINLYDSSFKNNIEFGIYSEQNLINQLISNPDEAAWQTCLQIANNNPVVFIKRPVYDSKKFIINIGKNYVKSDILCDLTIDFYGKHFRKDSSKKLLDYPDSIDFNSIVRPSREEVVEEPKKRSYSNRFSEEPEFGYCIRTGERIKFNPSQPLSKFAWKTWNEFGNLDFPEKYCHKTGKPSYGKTSMRNPIL